ncbi:MAG: ABC transporter ATP-binding protein [Gemmatimonadales bacterium]|nr:ABC transporter ATP-binding protein [Gemmatimonadales bacterium]
MTVVLGQDLTKVYSLNGRQVAALRGVSLTIAAGEYLAITGPSGSGKSTLLQLLGGLDSPTGGRLELMGRRVEGLSDDELTDLRLRQVGFIFQRFHLMPVLTARENVELPLAEAGVGRRERSERAAELLAYVGLADRADHRATQLSGGEMQRVAIARALANRPALILADEPTGELDAATGAQILELFDRLHQDGVTLVVVTHDEHLAARVPRRVHLLDGRIDRDELATAR